MIVENEKLTGLFDKILKFRVSLVKYPSDPVPFLLVSWIDVSVKVPLTEIYEWVRKRPSDVPYELVRKAAYDAARRLAKSIVENEKTANEENHG